MKTLNKALIALSLLVAFPAINAMGEDVPAVKAEVAAPNAEGTLAWLKNIGAQVYSYKNNRYAQVGGGVFVVTATGVVLYKKNATVQDVMDKAAAKAKAAYEATTSAGSSAVSTVKANPKKSAAAAVVVLAGAGAAVAYQQGYLTFGKEADEAPKAE